MMIKHLKINTEDLLFYMAYGIFLVFGILSTSFYYQYFYAVSNIINYFCIAILIFREFMIHRYDVKSLFIGVAFVALIILSRPQRIFTTVAFILIFLFCARNVDFKGIVRFTAWASAAVVLFVVASAYIGIITNYVAQGANRVRYYLGFRYSLDGPAFLFNITGLFIYLKKDKIRWLSLFVLAFLNIWMFLLTNSRLSFGLSILLILITGVLKIFPKIFEHMRVICLLMVTSFILCAGISIYFTATYDETVGWQKQLNNTIENRLEYGKSAIEEYGITLFGQDIQLIGNGLDKDGKQNTTDTYNYVDSFYIQVLLMYGIVFTVIWLGILTYTLYYFYKKGDYWLLLCLSFVAIHCILDDLSLALYYNTFWFSVSVAISSTSHRFKNMDLQSQLKKHRQDEDSQREVEINND